jgi:DNA-binding NtrC family response regulator
VPGYDHDRIASLEERLAFAAPRANQRVADLSMLVDLYLQADSYVPALETIDRLLELPEARGLSAARRAVLDSKAMTCRLAQGNAQGALAHGREALRNELAIDSLATRARLHLLMAEALFRLSRLPEAAEASRTGLERAQEAADFTLIGQALNLLGRVDYREGDLDSARSFYEQALAFHTRAGDELSCAVVRANLGLIHKNRCEWNEAVVQFNGALELRRRHGRYAETGTALLHLGIVHQKRGDWNESAVCYSQARQVFEQIGDQLRIAAVDIGLGNLARLRRRFVESETRLLDALRRSRAQAARREECLALEFLGELEAERGRPDAALVRYDEALALAERIAGEGDLVVEIERRRAEVLVQLGRLDAATTACERAASLADRIEDRLEHALTFRARSWLARARDRRDEARDHARRCVEQVTACNERFELGRSLLDLGRLTPESDEGRRALYHAVSLFSELKTAHWLEQAEEELRRLSRAGESPAVQAVSTNGRRHRAPGMVACSQGMRRVEAMAQRAAATELSVLITGETGSGKELIARTIHGLSTRQSGPFLAVNCGALRPDLALSQLFGHRKGAFTGAHAEGIGLVEAASGGTLFMDEVGELPHDVQVTLLRFLESGEYFRLGETQVRRSDVRVISATNRELRGARGEAQFRRDLLFRLNEIEIQLPSLRERREDIVPLARHFLAFYGGIDGPRLGADAEAILASYAWPGNVRELENVMKRVAALSAGNQAISAVDLLRFIEPGDPTFAPVVDERSRILSAFAEASGNKSRTAEILGVSRKTLYARLRRHGIELS